MAAKIHVPPKSTVLFQGALHKRGHVHRSWKERWFVLSSDFKLRYYESQSKSEQTFTEKQDRNVLGTIDSVDIERIEVAALLDTDKSQIPKTITEKKKDSDSHHEVEANAQGSDAQTLPASHTTLKHKHSESSRSLLIYLVTSS